MVSDTLFDIAPATVGKFNRLSAYNFVEFVVYWEARAE